MASFANEKVRNPFWIGQGRVSQLGERPLSLDCSSSNPSLQPNDRPSVRVRCPPPAPRLSTGMRATCSVPGRGPPCNVLRTFSTKDCHQSVTKTSVWHCQLVPVNLVSADLSKTHPDKWYGTSSCQSTPELDHENKLLELPLLRLFTDGAAAIEAGGDTVRCKHHHEKTKPNPSKRFAQKTFLNFEGCGWDKIFHW